MSLHDNDTARIDIRKLGASDIDTLMEWRMEVIDDVFADHEPWDEDAVREANKAYYEELIGTEHIACIASVDGADAACGAICLQRELPSPDNPSGRCAYLMNVYTRPAFRHHGLGAKIVEWLVEQGRAHGADKIYLESSIMAKPLYHELGFTPIKGMMKLDEEHLADIKAEDHYRPSASGDE